MGRTWFDFVRGGPNMVRKTHVGVSENGVYLPNAYFSSENDDRP
jgi:hypothetical protein